MRISKNIAILTISFLKIAHFPKIQYLSSFALLFNIAKEKGANLYVLDEHLRQEKEEKKQSVPESGCHTA